MLHPRRASLRLPRASFFFSYGFWLLGMFMMFILGMAMCNAFMLTSFFFLFIAQQILLSFQRFEFLSDIQICPDSEGMPSFLNHKIFRFFSSSSHMKFQFKIYERDRETEIVGSYLYVYRSSPVLEEE